jgi:hypothetical protein
VGVAIRELIDANRLSATSCMTGTSYWAAEASLLRPFAHKADIGLHVTLTDHTPLGTMLDLAPSGRFPSKGRLFMMAVTHRLNKDEIMVEIERQLDSFIAEIGRLPDFIDGHHHVHQLPIVRKAVLDIWRRRLSKKGSWVRTCCEPFRAVTKRGIAVPKAVFLGWIGAPLKRSMVACGVPHNASFLGIYRLSWEQNFGSLFERFMKEIRPRTLFMCHPGQVDDPLRAMDTLTNQREEEFRFFVSSEFERVLESKGLMLVRLSESPT